jgi:hypothetical protein
VRKNPPRKSTILAGLLLAVVLLIACGGCGGKDPAAILRAALEKSSTAASLEADILVETEPEGGSRSIPLTAEGAAAVDQVARSAMVSFGAMGFQVELRYVAGKAYIQLGDAWYALAAGADFISGLAQGVAESAFSYPELLGKFTRVEEGGTEKVAGRDCYRLRVSLDLQALAEVPAVKKIGTVLGIDPADILSELQAMAPDVEVWVDRKDSYIRKIAVAAGVDTGGGVLGFDLLKGRIRLEATAVFSDYNQPLDIEAPETTTPFDPDLLPF